MRDARSGEPLAYVAVYLADRSTGTATDRNGYYVLPGIPDGERQVVFSIVGYEELTLGVTVRQDRPARLDARLAVQAIPVRGVTSSATHERFKREVDVGVKRLEYRDLKIAPGMIEQDLFKSLQMLPGVIAVSDFASALYVRGGSSDQNLVLLDGVTVYNPYHLGGLFSTFNLDALSNAELKAGAFPAEYGNAVSSVLDVEMKQGNSERYSGRWDVGLLTTKLLFEGPFPHGSFLVAARRTYIDAVTWAIDKMVADPQLEIYLPYYFYDLQAKANFDAGDKDRLTLSGYSGDDVLFFNDTLSRTDFRWGNYTLALKWRHIFSPELLSTALVTRGRNRVALAASEFGTDTTTSGLSMGISDWGMKEDVTWFADSGQTVRFGFEGKLFDIRNRLYANDSSVWDLSNRPAYAALYATDKWQPVAPLLVNVGVRAEYFSSGRYFRVAPRLSAKYFVRDDIAVSAAYGHYYQYLSIPFPRDEMIAKLPATFFQQWIPADDKLKPVFATHYVLGGEKLLGDNGSVSLEGYYKQMRNVLESGSALPGIGPMGDVDTVRFKSGSGWAAGAEVLLKWKNSWVGYGLSWTRRTFDSTSFYPIFDARHNFNVAWTANIGRGWQVNATWLLRSGFPYTGPIGQFQHVDGDPYQPDEENGWWENPYSWQTIAGRRGNYRLPAYHRLDIGLEKSFRLFRLDWSFYFQVMNVYARKNVLWYDYYTDEHGRLIRTPQTILPIPIPSFGLRGRF